MEVILWICDQDWRHVLSKSTDIQESEKPAPMLVGTRWYTIPTSKCSIMRIGQPRSSKVISRLRAIGTITPPPAITTTP